MEPEVDNLDARAFVLFGLWLDEGWELEEFLQTKCPNEPSLRRRVGELANVHIRNIDEGIVDPILMDGSDATLTDQSIGIATDSSSNIPVSIRGYRIIGRIGEGGMGTILRAIQPYMGRAVAIKVLSHSFVQRVGTNPLSAEIAVHSKLMHVGIVRAYHAGTFSEGDHVRHFLVMELVDGSPPGTPAPTLVDHAHRMATLRDRVELFLKVCDAVHFAHERGVIHRDLNPNNILVDPQGEPKVLDFGVAKNLGSLSPRYDAFNGDPVGVRDWMSPEQFLPCEEPVDIRTDIYTMGLLLDAMFENLYATDSNRGMRKNSSWLFGTAAADLQRTLEKAAAASRDDRFKSVIDLKGALENYLSLLPPKDAPAPDNIAICTLMLGLVGVICTITGLVTSLVSLALHYVWKPVATEGPGLMLFGLGFLLVIGAIIAGCAERACIWQLRLYPGIVPRWCQRPLLNALGVVVCILPLVALYASLVFASFPQESLPDALIGYLAHGVFLLLGLAFGVGVLREYQGPALVGLPKGRNLSRSRRSVSVRLAYAAPMRTSLPWRQRQRILATAAVAFFIFWIAATAWLGRMDSDDYRARQRLIGEQNQCMNFQSASNLPIGDAAILAPSAQPFLPRSSSSRDLMFMHGMKNPNGSERLVTVVCDSIGGSTSIIDGSVGVSYRVWRPATATSTLLDVTRETMKKRSDGKNDFPRNAVLSVFASDFAQNFALATRRVGPRKLFFGHLDSENPSHFTVEFQDGVDLGVIDGWLRDDDSLEFKVRRHSS